MENKITRFIFLVSSGGPIALLVFFLLGLGGVARAQSTATVKGSVTDASGAPVPKAKILVRNQGTGGEWTSQTDDAGNYLIPALPVGVYRIEASAQSFQTSVIRDLKLDVATTVIQNLRLKLGEVTQQVVITGEAPVIDASTTTVGQVINQRTVQEIPLNGRHFVDLGLLIPGSVTPPQNGFLTFPLRGQGSFAFNTAGQREDTVNFMINGINLNDEVQNQITFQPSVNTVQEFKVDNSTYSAQYGRNSGAIVNIATRSGTNQLHGEVFDFFRNNALDARNFFNPRLVLNPATKTLQPNPQAQFIRNNFGAAVGGPIKRDRAFFFASYEGLRQHQGVSVVTDVPTDAQRAAVTNPVVQKLLKLIPPANGADSKGNAAFLGSISAPVQIDQGTGDLSIDLTKNDRLHGYYALQKDVRIEPTLQGNNLPGFGDTREARRQVMTINEDHIFSPTLTNEARLGFNRLHITFTPNALLNPADFGINNGINAPAGLPQIGVSGALNIGGPAGFPQGRGDTTGVFSDTLIWQRGRHSFAFGGEVRRFYNNNAAQNIGSFGFTSLANFLNDNGNSFTVLLGSGSNKILESAWGAFVEDSFKWRPNFTLVLGLRYDWNASPSESRDRFVVFDPSGNSLVQVGTNGFDKPYHTNNKNFQPRLGFSWDPFNDGKTVVRGAYAVLTDQPVTNSVTGLSSNPPFADPRVVNGPVKFENALPASGSAGLAPATINRSFDNPYVQSWNLNIQREITPTLGVMVGYFGSKGTHLRIARNINQPLIGQEILKSKPVQRPVPNLSSSSPIDPANTVGNITQVDSGGNSSYNALWMSVNKRISHGLQFNASYTFSKSLDNNSLSSQGVVVQDSFNIGGDRGLSDFDARHRFVINAIYDLPLKGNRLFEGWEIGVISQAQSGNPLTILLPDSRATANFTLRPDVTGAIQVTGNPAQWFANTSIFVVPSKPGPNGGTIFHFGNLGRNAVRGPTFVNTDLSIIKNTKLTERLNLQFRTEMFDVFNHPNFGNPGRFLGTLSFGQIQGTRFPTGDFGSSRQVQFALKLQF